MQLPLICSFHRFKLPDKLQEKTVCTIEAVRTWESTCPVSVVTRRPGEQSKPNEFDLRQVGLLPVNKGDQLKLIKVYMGPRILAQNQHGEYGLVQARDVGGINSLRECPRNEVKNRRRCSIM
ncbi:hypothetical protein FBUS_00852 [Fasciolopsis buskii]|uniref:Uncharacterized protein n=1 Tax=Fasciolopsis buskii TaxID=27845 RepID=A0A8E0VHT9_9TREM|nr:hypothetical protein FBUS_00852 [Fasciolopsis buski]